MSIMLQFCRSRLIPYAAVEEVHHFLPHESSSATVYNIEVKAFRIWQPGAISICFHLSIRD